jgi:hypothetical protein
MFNEQLQAGSTHLLFGTSFAFLPMLTSAGIRAVSSATPVTIDDQLSRLDHRLSVQICLFVGRHPAVHWGLWLAYIAIPLFIALVLICSPSRSDCARSLALSTAASPFFYSMFPAVGPAWVSTPGAARNCFSSMHMTWALLLLLYAPSRLRWFAGVFVLLTLGATLGLGEHYIIDLVVALPYGVLCAKAANIRWTWSRLGPEPFSQAPAAQE